MEHARHESQGKKKGPVRERRRTQGGPREKIRTKHNVIYV